MRLSQRASLILLCAVFVSPTGKLLAQKSATRSAAQLFPSSTIAYAEIAEPSRLFDLAVTHPLRKQVEATKQYKAYIGSKEYRQLLVVLFLAENQLGMKWQDGLKSFFEQGVYVGFDAKTQGAALLVRAKDKKSLAKIRDTLIKFVDQNAKSNNQPSPAKSTKYKGFDTYKAGEARFAVLDEWLVVTNKPSLGKQMVDRYADGGGDSLAGNAEFKKAYSSAKGKSLWAYVDLATVRKSGMAKDVFKGKADNPGVELFFGGLLSNLQKTPFATMSLTVERTTARLTLGVPHSPNWVPETREYYFGPKGKGQAPPLLNLKSSLLTLSTYRDFSLMWLRSGDLYDENTNDAIAAAESNLSTLFSGRDFGEDILGSFKPEVQLIVTRQTFDKDRPIPAIKVPAFAMAFTMKNPKRVQSELRRIFQSLIGFLNVVGAMEGQPQLDQEMEKRNGAQILSSMYVPEEGKEKSKAAPLNFNFSPSVAFLKDRFVVSSSKTLANEIVDYLGKAKAAAKKVAAVTNTQLRVDLQGVKRILGDNREQLIAQNMLQDGNSRKEAEGEIDALLGIVGLFKDLRGKLAAVGGQLEFALEVDIQADKTTEKK